MKQISLYLSILPHWKYGHETYKGRKIFYRWLIPPSNQAPYSIWISFFSFMSREESSASVEWITSITQGLWHNLKCLTVKLILSIILHSYNSYICNSCYTNSMMAFCKITVKNSQTDRNSWVSWPLFLLTFFILLWHVTYNIIHFFSAILY